MNAAVTGITGSFRLSEGHQSLQFVVGDDGARQVGDWGLEGIVAAGDLLAAIEREFRKERLKVHPL